MALKDLFFSIFAQDKSGTAFDSLNRNLNNSDKAAKSLSDRLGTAGKSMTAFGAAGSIASIGLASAFNEMLGLYDAQAKAEARVAKSIENTGGAVGFTVDELKDQAEALQSISTFGDQDILGGVTSQMLLFGNISGDVFSEAQKLAVDLAAAYGTDLSDAADRVGKALANPREELEGLAEVGIWFTDEQKNMLEAMQATGDMAAAQGIILDRMREKWGGQAEAVRDAGAGVLQAWKHTWGDLKEEVGGVFAEILPPVVSGMTSLAQAFEGLSPGAKRFTVIMGAMAVALPPLIGGVGLLVAGFAAISAPVLGAVAGVSALAAVFATFWPEIQSTYEWVSAKLGGALQTVTGLFSALPQPVQDVTTVLVGMMNPITLLAVGIDDFGAAFSRVFSNVKDIVIDTVTAVSDWLGNKFNALMDSVGTKVEWVEGKFAWLYDKVVGNSWVPDLVDEVGQSFAKLDGSMVKVTDDATGSVNDSFKGLWSDVSGGLKSMVTDGEVTFTGFMETLNNVGERYADKIVGNVFDTLSDGIGDALSSVFSGASTGSASSGGLGGIFSGLSSWASGLLGFDTGGAFTVTGRAGMDRNVAAVRLSEGEEVNVTKRGQSSAPVVQVNIQTQDVSSFKSSKAQIGRQLAAAVNAGMRAT